MAELSRVWCLNIKSGTSAHEDKPPAISDSDYGTGCRLPDGERRRQFRRREERTVNAGPAGNYSADGVYSNFCDQGFFVIRKGEKLSALSAICTHRKCKLTAESDQSFYCKCHGSTFDPAGHVTAGPAKRDLPVFPISPDERGQLLVKVSGV